MRFQPSRADDYGCVACGSYGGCGCDDFGAPSFSFPLSTYTLTSGFGPRVHPVTGEVGKMHNGVDLAAPTGTPVYAVAPGVVTTVGYTDINGNWIKVDHGEGYATAYLHLSRTDVARGAQVVAGQQLGAVGATGRVTGPHLHFILYKDGQEVDPLLHLGKIALVAGVTSTALVVAGTMAVGGIAIALAWAYTRKR